MPSTHSSSVFFFSSRRRHTSSLCDWSSDVCSSDLVLRLVNGLTGFLEARAAWDDWDSTRSEERRVGKECRSQGAADDEKKKKGARKGMLHQKAYARAVHVH